MPAPSGRQIRLVHGEQEAVVTEVGAGLRTYTANGAGVLDGFGETEMCSGGRGQVLMPWPNRLGDGRFEWTGRQLQTALTEPENGNAIHGLVRWNTWTVVEENTSAVRLEYRLYPQPGWPWILDLSMTYALSDAGLEVRGRAVNVAGGAEGAGDCPFGAGWHPYLAAFDGRVDDLVLTVRARTTYESDSRGLPTRSLPVAGTPVDFRTGRRIGDLRLDTAYTDLDRDAAGRAAIEISAGDRSTRLWMDAACTHLMVFSGDTLPEAERRRGLAVEPMTCAPNMLQTGDGRRVLRAGEAFEAVWGLSSG
jgi:aldose 1-epimerase